MRKPEWIYRRPGSFRAVHDPYVKHWWEFEKQESYPAPGHSWSRFFRNQDKRSDLRMTEDLPAALKGSDAVVLAVRHSPYLALTPQEVLDMQKPQMKRVHL